MTFGRPSDAYRFSAHASPRLSPLETALGVRGVSLTSSWEAAIDGTIALAAYVKTHPVFVYPLKIACTLEIGDAQDSIEE